LKTVPWNVVRCRPLSASVALLAVSTFATMASPSGTIAAKTSPVVLQFWNPAEGAVSKKVIANLVARFNATHPGILVKDDTVSNSDAYAKYTAGLSSGSPPNVILTYDSYPVPLWVADHLVQPLNAYLKKYDVSLPKYFPSVYQETRYQGKTYALPLEVDAPMLAWNKKLFQEAGLNPNDPPKTVAALLSDATKLTKFQDGHLVQMGIVPGDTYESWYNSTWVYSFGGRLYNASTDEPTVDSAADVATYNWLAKLYKAQGGVEQVLALGNKSAAGDPFLSNTAAMEVMGEWVPSYVPLVDKSLSYGVAPLPVAPGVKYGTTFLSPADVYVLPVGATHVQQTLTFMKWMSSPYAVYYWCTNEGNLPPAPSMLFSTYFYDHAPHERPWIQALHHAVADGLAGSPIASQVLTDLGQTEDQIFYGQTTPAAGLKSLEARLVSAQQQFNASHPGR
jgi:multiple sugar transport system substrate-binding protein